MKEPEAQGAANGDGVRTVKLRIGSRRDLHRLLCNNVGGCRTDDQRSNGKRTYQSFRCGHHFYSPFCCLIVSRGRVLSWFPLFAQMLEDAIPIPRWRFAPKPLDSIKVDII